MGSISLEAYKPSFPLFMQTWNSWGNCENKNHEKDKREYSRNELFLNFLWVHVLFYISTILLFHFFIYLFIFLSMNEYTPTLTIHSETSFQSECLMTWRNFTRDWIAETICLITGVNRNICVNMFGIGLSVRNPQRHWSPTLCPTFSLHVVSTENAHNPLHYCI